MSLGKRKRSIGVSATETLDVDDGFKRQLMPLSPVEFSMLEESILADGCREKLIVWSIPQGDCDCGANAFVLDVHDPDDDYLADFASWQCTNCSSDPESTRNVLIDGHNRYEICKRHGIPFEIEQKDFDSRADVEEWIDRNQAGRRNCSPEDYKILTGRIYNRRKKRHDEAGAMKSSPQFEVGSQTSDKVGKEFGLSGATIERNAIRAEVYDDIADESPELAADVKKWTQKDIEAIASKPADDGKKQKTTKEERIAEARRAAELKAAKATHVSLNTGMPEWYTPRHFIDAARNTMGSIDTDPASSEIAQRTVQAGVFFTVEDDGLSHDWVGNVWMNPPYTAGLVDRFIDKLVRAIRNGSVPQACVLINNATETKWFQLAASVASAVCFPASRIRFLDPEGNPGAPLQGQAILYMGSNYDLFTEEHKEFGVVWKRV